MRREWMVLGLGLLVGGYGIGQWPLLETRMISAQESPAATAAVVESAATPETLVETAATPKPLVEQYVEAARQKFLALDEQQQRVELEAMQAELKQSLAEKRLKELQAELRKLQAEFPATGAAQVARGAADLIDAQPVMKIRVQELVRPAPANAIGFESIPANFTPATPETFAPRPDSGPAPRLPRARPESDIFERGVPVR